MRITVCKDGPYLVEGAVPLLRAEIVADEAGEPCGWRELGRIEAGDSYALCRCGHSQHPPFCDGTHVAVGFDGTETAGHEAFAGLAEEVGSSCLGLSDVKPLCASARFCTRAGGLWHLVERCDDPEVRALAVEEAQLCPAGRYVAHEADGAELEPEFEPSIVLIEDPMQGVSGPIFVRGGIEIVDADGTPYEVRNRVTLCRCGASANKPFCDGSHRGIGYHEEG